MSIRLGGVILSGLLAASCAAPAATVAPSPSFAASECTSATATMRQVVERYFALSTSSSARAVTDCFARPWRDSPQFAESAELWSRSGPATDLVVTLLDVVNGCDRFRVTARMSSDSWWMRGQTGGQGFFSVGADAGRPRIYQIATALANQAATTLRCG